MLSEIFNRCHQHFMLIILLFLLILLTTMTMSEEIESTNGSACKQPPSPGLCLGRVLRYAYDHNTGNCVSFYYTGCAATENNFLTFEECRRDCMQQLRY